MGWNIFHPILLENIMDQTKFINTYIANLAEKIKALTLDNIMLTTQLNLSNERNSELEANLEKWNDAKSSDEAALPLSDYK